MWRERKLRKVRTYHHISDDVNELAQNKTYETNQPSATGKGRREGKREKGKWKYPAGKSHLQESILTYFHFLN